MNSSSFLIPLLITINLFSVHNSSFDEEFCLINQKDDCDKQNTITKNNRYLLYDINPPEGFNLRRDVYVRMAVFSHNLQNSNNKKLSSFKLVLPPWTNMYHWARRERQKHIPWSHFFDLQSLQQFAPVIEMYQFFNEIPSKDDIISIDDVYILKHFDDMFETGNFEERMSITECEPTDDVNFYHYTNLTSKNIKCLSFHGHTKQLKDVLLKSDARTILFDHAEVPLHDEYGRKLYWKARRSMRFNRNLNEIADTFRKRYLNSTDESDNTVLPVNWEEEKLHRNAKGGPYLGVHLRRRDFIWGRPKQIPSIRGAAKQIQKLLNKLDLDVVFIATDAPKYEWDELKLSLERYKVSKFDGSDFGDGQTAIIDQIICSHARYFIGTHESTFSFRIQEEREILGFPISTTFDRLCGDDENPCEGPSKWTIVH